MADGDFLRTHVYPQDTSRFVGSTYKYLAAAALPERPRHVLTALEAHLASQANMDPQVSRWLERFTSQLPAEVCTLIQLPAETPAEDSVEQCVQQGARALASSLRARLPYAWFFANVRRYLRQHRRPPCPASPNERRALLENYHLLLMAKARKRFPETWDTARGHYILDSRGAAFAWDFTCELVSRGLLGTDCRFLDIGSGVGTMMAAAAMNSGVHATGVEIHPGLVRLARSLFHRLGRHYPALQKRIQCVAGDVHCQSVVDIADFDVLYLYSPLVKSEIEVGPLVQRMRVGSLIITERLPTDHLDLVHFEPKVSGLFALRRVEPS